MAYYPPPTENLPIFDTSVFDNAYLVTTGTTESGLTIADVIAGNNINISDTSPSIIISTNTDVTFTSVTASSYVTSTDLRANNILYIKDNGSNDTMQLYRTGTVCNFVGTANTSKNTSLDFWTVAPSVGVTPQLKMYVSVGGTGTTYYNEFRGDITASGSIKANTTLEAPSILLGAVDVGASITSFTSSISSIQSTISNITSQFTTAFNSLSNRTTANETNIINLNNDVSTKQQQLQVGSGLSLIYNYAPNFSRLSLQAPTIVIPDPLNTGTVMTDGVFYDRINHNVPEGTYMVVCDCPLLGTISGTPKLYLSEVQLKRGSSVVMTSSVTDVVPTGEAQGQVKVNITGIVTTPVGGGNIVISQNAKFNTGSWTMAGARFNIVKLK